MLPIFFWVVVGFLDQTRPTGVIYISILIQVHTHIHNS